MYVVIRSYSGENASEVFDLIEERIDEVRDLISDVPGFVSYTAFRFGDGGTALTVCEDKEGTDKSTSVAAKWVLENVNTTPPVPHIEEGSSVAHISGG
ncbi:MAG: hypothetical protein ACSLFI_00930 [Solirubrobacterales bacterium]